MLRLNLPAQDIARPAASPLASSIPDQDTTAPLLQLRILLLLSVFLIGQMCNGCIITRQWQWQWQQRSSRRQTQWFRSYETPFGVDGPKCRSKHLFNIFGGAMTERTSSGKYCGEIISKIKIQVAATGGHIGSLVFCHGSIGFSLKVKTPINILFKRNCALHI